MFNLKFFVKNLGVIKEGTFTQKPLTLFCGPNNSGKTWVMYSLYHCHQGINFYCRQQKESKGKQKESKGQRIRLDSFNKELSKRLSHLFNTREELLQDARFHLRMESEEEFDALLCEGTTNRNLFLMPAERNGLHLFFRELSTRRTALLHHASREKIDLSELLKDVIRSRYAIPIADYIDWLNQLPEIQRDSTGDFHQRAKYLEKELAKGTYHVDKRTGDIKFKPYQRSRNGRRTQRLGLHMTSSAVKSLFGLWFYLKNQAQKGDILMIDEPEINIHPENQRIIARLLAKLVNAGINVVISTHSDYIVRELNTLIMLNQDDGTLREKHKYEEEEILNPDKVAAWLFDNQEIKPFEISPDDGIYAKTFDEVIQDLNTTNDDIYYDLQEQQYDSNSSPNN